MRPSERPAGALVRWGVRADAAYWWGMAAVVLTKRVPEAQHANSGRLLEFGRELAGRGQLNRSHVPCWTVGAMARPVVFNVLTVNDVVRGYRRALSTSG